MTRSRRNCRKIVSNIFVLDTSVYIANPECLEDKEFANSTIVLPVWVVDEIDRLKYSKENGWHARKVSRNIEAYCRMGFLSKGVPTKRGGLLIGESRCELPSGIEPTADNKIILLAQRLGQKTPKKRVTVVSRDRNLRTKASIFGVNARGYTKRMSAPRIPFPGYTEITLKSDLIEQLYRDNALDISAVADSSTYATDTLAPNECIYLFFEGTYALGIYKKEAGKIRLVPKQTFHEDEGENGSKSIRPRNDEQAFAYALLTDPDIQIVALFGSAGSGKTLMALLGAYEQVVGCSDKTKSSRDDSIHRYKRIIVVRSPIEAGPPMGSLPGTIHKKFNPYTIPIYENLNLIMRYGSSCGVDDLINAGILEISPPNYMRGRTLRDAFAVFDETQNFTRGEIKMLASRPDYGSKIVLTGDITQIDNPASYDYNGLYHVISRLKGQDIFGYTVMNDGLQRGHVAQLAATLL